MNLKRLLLLSALLMLFVRPATAQPGCPHAFDAFKACNYHYFNGEYVLFGEVIKVKKIEGSVEGYTGALKVTVAVEESIKGQVGREVELTLYGQCAFDVRENSKRIFIAKWVSTGEAEGLLSRDWSFALDENPPDKIAALVEKIKNILQGQPQPRIFGKVAELDPRFLTSGRAWASYPPRPLPGVAVVAIDKDGNQIQTQTDAEGNYSFSELPFGMYTVNPILPNQMEILSSYSVLPREKQQVEVDGRICGFEMSFAVQQSGNITGRLEGIRDWRGTPYLSLYRTGSREGELNINDKSPDFSVGYFFPSYVRPETGAGTGFEFGFDHLPVGNYVLRYEIDRVPVSFYPLALTLQNAELIKVEVGKQTSININVPSFQERKIFGRVTLADGSPVTYATIQLIDEIEPDAPLGRMDYSNGEFNISVWEGRPFRLYAYYASKKDGKNVRFFTRTEKMILKQDMGPVTITLDRIEPY